MEKKTFASLCVAMSDLNALAELRSDLLAAASHLREQGNFNFWNDQPDLFTTDELAALIEHLAERLDGRDKQVVERLWGIFAPTSVWDDARGDSHIANKLFEKLNELFKSNKETQ
jgi:hypothetical protein